MSLGFSFLFFLSCTFCKPEIIETQKVYTTEHFNVLVDIGPRVPGHLIVVLKEHKPSAHLLTAEEWQDLAAIIPKAVSVFQKVHGTDQYIILEKNGPKAFQSIPHVHFHLLPVTNQPWLEIFADKVKRMKPEKMEREVRKYREYFNEYLIRQRK